MTPEEIPAIERDVLGALLYGAPVDQVADILRPDDFQSMTLDNVYRAVLRVAAAGGPVNPHSVRRCLDQAQVTYNPVELATLGAGLMTSQVEWYAGQLAEAAGMRRLRSAAIKIDQLGQSAMPLEEASELARAAVDGAAGPTRNSTQSLDVGEGLAEVIDIAQRGSGGGLSTPWPDLDRYIGGIYPGRLIVVGARPSVGKSLIGTNLAHHFAHVHQRAALLASLEMPRTEVTQRLLALHAKANLTDLMSGQTTDEATWERIAAAQSELAAMPLTVDASPHQSLAHLSKTTRDLKRRRPNLVLVVVDYLQLMATTGRVENRAQAVGELSRGLKLLAREMEVCVVAMAQLNRNPTAAKDTRPKMSDLRESGSIEADADQVVLLHQDPKKPGEVECITDKNRHGPKGVCDLVVHGHYARLASVEWNPANPR